MAPTPDDLDGVDRSHVDDDGTLARLSIRRTDDDADPSGWRYTLHYGAFTSGQETLDDGTLRRYDNAHEDTKGHELHVAPDPEPQDVEFPGMAALYERFWDETSKSRFGPSDAAGDTHD